MKPKSMIMGLVFVVLWSSAFTSAKIIVEYAPPLLALAVRFFLTGLIGLTISKIFFTTKNLNQLEWLSLIGFGICQNSIYLGLNFVAMGNIDAFLAVVIASLLPIFVVVISWITRIEKIGFLGIVGMLCGLIGCWIILSQKILILSNLIGIILCLIGTLALALATLLVRNTISQKSQLLRIVSLQMLVGGFPLILISFIMEPWAVQFSTSFVLAFLYTCFFPGLIATIIWFNLVRKEGVIRASSFHFLNPPMGVLIAALVLAENITTNDILGIITLMLAIILIQISKVTKSLKI
ncbi:MAG: DMT family transporter [Paracoccaceae bacterium]|nr:DMT family transporter [Paracoccaceae bacterium]